MTFASQAVTNSLPGGSAVSAVYGFRWFRRFGADDTLAAWSLVGVLVASVVSLSLVAAIGLALATGEGASLDLVPVIVGVLLITMALGALFVYERPLRSAVSLAIRASRAVAGRPRGDVAAQIEKVVAMATAVRLGWRQIVTITLWGVFNWLFDCACFAMMFLAVNASIPWKGLLLAYGAGQLVAFGGARVATVDAVLMYRVISFWLVLVVGWTLWGQLALQARRGRWILPAFAANAAGVTGAASGRGVMASAISSEGER
jgi:hypothetical protein